MKADDLFPLVGILASKGNKENTFRGDSHTFKQLQFLLHNEGGLSFIFTLEDFHSTYVDGYVFIKGQSKWAKIVLPLPQIIYNRLSTRQEEQSTDFQRISKIAIKKQITITNPSFFNKWDTYKLLSENEALKPYLPKTIHYSGEQSLLYMLNTFPAIYFKPHQGSKGKGIYKLSCQKQQYIIIDKTGKRLSLSKANFLRNITQLAENEPYLLQEEIHTDTIEGHKYDLRVLCIYNDGIYVIRGIGVRVASAGRITTHVPNGGSIVPLHLVKDKFDQVQLEWLADKVGKILEKYYGFIGEFSMDIGIDLFGTPYLFEVNSKPMVFDEEDIQQPRLHHLVSLFQQKSSINYQK
ncbi:YheC/YheD family protein [Metabacillus herbersteinensis]|uniref:YheC/YheD family protein n=1 Tax=Metabacillus herbersteinensis TaxID=283816 RepID=A0ABV6GEK9_9BACI